MTCLGVWRQSTCTYLVLGSWLQHIQALETMKLQPGVQHVYPTESLSACPQDAAQVFQMLPCNNNYQGCRKQLFSSSSLKIMCKFSKPPSCWLNAQNKQFPSGCTLWISTMNCKKLFSWVNSSSVAISVGQWHNIWFWTCIIAVPAVQEASDWSQVTTVHSLSIGECMVSSSVMCGAWVRDTGKWCHIQVGKCLKTAKTCAYMAWNFLESKISTGTLTFMDVDLVTWIGRLLGVSRHKKDAFFWCAAYHWIIYCFGLLLIDKAITLHIAGSIK